VSQFNTQDNASIREKCVFEALGERLMDNDFRLSTEAERSFDIEVFLRDTLSAEEYQSLLERRELLYQDYAKILLDYPEVAKQG